MESEQLILNRTLGLSSVGQLAFIVHDVRVSLPAFASLYNLKTWFEPLYAEKEFKINGEVKDLEFNIAFAYSGKVQIELFEEKSQQAAVYQDHLDSYGPGLHHLGFYVSDLDAKLEKARQLDLDILLEANFKTAGGGFVRYVYLDTRPLCGIITELLHITLYGIKVPQTEFVMNMAKFTGDVKKLTI
jgi:hypothetical protein